MKKNILCILFCAIGFSTFSQASFKKGYFIKNSGEKIDCYIFDEDWKNNFTKFNYKFNGDSQIKTLDIESVSELMIFNESKYKRHTVKVDKSSDKSNKLSSSKSPDFQTEQVFLKVLLEGKANLYFYSSGNIRRYFYKTSESPEVKQLIYKSYLLNRTDKVAKNYRYRQQLLSDLKCSNITLEDVKNIEYKKKELINLFIKYNDCKESEYVIYDDGLEKKGEFNLSLRLGLNNSKMSIENTSLKSRSADFDSNSSLRFGVELEYILPFNNGKWSFLIEPSYQTYEAKKEIAYINTPTVKKYANLEVEYKSIEIPIGIRHYSFISTSSALFFNAFLVLDFPSTGIVDVLEEEASFNNFNDIELSTSPNFAIGAGYNHNNKYSFELRYAINREVVNDIAFYNTQYNTLSMIFGYTIF